MVPNGAFVQDRSPRTAGRAVPRHRRTGIRSHRARARGNDLAARGRRGRFGGRLAGLAATIPWPSLPSATLLALPISTDVVIAVLRQAQGGSASGYGPLVILPVVWVGLTQGRRAVAAMSLCSALVFAVPVVVIGGSLYPTTGWRSVVLWAVVATVIGIGVNRAVAHHRRRTEALRVRTLGLGQLVETQAAIAAADVGSAGLMTQAAKGALALTSADGACIELLDGDEVVCAAAAGVAVEFLGVRLKADESITGKCFHTREVLICTDSEEDTRVHREACRMVGARSMILVPLLSAGDVKGVLLVWSATPHDFRGLRITAPRAPRQHRRRSARPRRADREAHRPGRHRRADRARQPACLVSPARPGAGTRTPHRPAAQHPDSRPRRVQAGQRRARSHRRRRPAQGRQRPLGGRAAGHRPARADRGRRVRRHPRADRRHRRARGHRAARTSDHRPAPRIDRTRRVGRGRGRHRAHRPGRRRHVRAQARARRHRRLTPAFTGRWIAGRAAQAATRPRTARRPGRCRPEMR